MIRLICNRDGFSNCAWVSHDVRKDAGRLEKLCSEYAVSIGLKYSFEQHQILLGHLRQAKFHVGTFSKNMSII